MSDSRLSIAGAMNAHIMTQDLCARNLANVNTPGFKRNIAIVEASSASNGSAKPAVTGIAVDLSQGAGQPTYNSFDFAIHGEGFFTVAGPDGPRYTRNGNFSLNENRSLVTQQGQAVIGDAGEIQVPLGQDNITVSSSGEIRAGEALIGKLKITAFDRPEMLRQTGASQFRDEGAAPRDAQTYKVQQGVVEASNVNSVSEMVRMVATMRDYESCARSLKSLEDSASKLYSWARS